MTCSQEYCVFGSQSLKDGDVSAGCGHRNLNLKKGDTLYLKP